MLARSTVYTCIQLSKVLALKLHIVGWCDLCLNEKESLRLHSPIVWLKTSLGRNDTEGVQVLAVVSHLRGQVLSLFEVLLKKQSTLKCCYLKITSGTWWMKIDFPSESRNKNCYFFAFLSSALIFKKSRFWSQLLHLPAFIFVFFKKSSVYMFWEKSLTICILNSLCLEKQNKYIPLCIPVPSNIILITVHDRLPQQPWAREVETVPVHSQGEWSLTAACNTEAQ